MFGDRVKVSLVKQIGLECPRCGCKDLRVVYTKRKPGGKIMRRRECRHCGRRTTTWERPKG